MAKSGTRPALDVDLPGTADSLTDIVEAVVDDFHPFAIETTAELQDASTSGARSRQRIHFFLDSDRHAAATALVERLGNEGVTATPVDVPDDGADWAARSQEGLRAIRVGRVIVAPPWDRTELSDDTPVIVIRPSMGFGTGHHASTRLCLRALQGQPLHGATVTDLGTGSGVLAIAATKLGAVSVAALDHDPDALLSAKENVQVNDVGDVVALRQVDLHTASLPRPADVVVANLNGAILSRLADRVMACATPGGTVILGGLTHDEQVGVTRAFAPVARLDESISENDWVCLILKARGGGIDQG